MYHFYYLADGEAIIRVASKTRPSKRSRRMFKVQEYDGQTWSIPTFPEVTGIRLAKLTFLGKVKQPEGGALVCD